MASSTTLDCPICTDVLEDPRVLPCGHSYCGPPKSCIEVNTSKCAVCSTEFKEMNLDELKPLYGIRDALVDLSAKTSETPRYKSSWPKCDAHCENKITLWCNDCSLQICVDCIEDKHINHTFKSIKLWIRERAGKMALSIKYAGLMSLECEKKIAEAHEQIVQLEKDKETFDLMSASEDKIQTLGKGEVDVVVDEDLNSLLSNNCLINLKAKVKPFSFEAEFGDIMDIKDRKRYSNSHRLYKFDLKAVLQHKLDKDNKPFLGVFLDAAPIDKNLITWRFELEFEVTLLNAVEGKNQSQRCNKEMNEKEKDWGFADFIEWGVLMDPNSGWLSNNQKIRVRITINEF
ncbi:tripartite motif containing 13-like [Symsagittifera roscoffensis]|uniref:tripartite motif containing 13-like n=1 Tax=Symsagittifera roscoffensis TaxID=84072 RepID=UPI00307B117F